MAQHKGIQVDQLSPARDRSIKRELQDLFDGAGSPEQFVHGLSSFLAELPSGEGTHPVLAALGDELSRAAHASYAASALHDLRTLVQIMMLGAEHFLPVVAQSAVARSGGRAHEALVDFRAAARSAMECLDDVDFEYRKAADETCELADVLGVAVSLGRRFFGARPTFELRAPDRVRVSASQTRLVRVLGNLLHNAAHATRLKDRPVVKVATWITEAHAFVQISDNGPGIPSALRSEIFEMFYTTKAQGSGIGLFVCQTFVSGWGGKILVERSDEGGARFIFSIPRIEN